MGTESEIAASVVFLLSPAASYITGVNLPVDGASSLSKGDNKGPAVVYNPKGSRMKPYIGWPSSDSGAEGADKFKELDAPGPVAKLYEKYKLASKL